MLSNIKTILGLSRSFFLKNNACLLSTVRNYRCSPSMHQKKKKAKKRKAPEKDEYESRLFSKNPLQKQPVMEVQNKVAIITGGTSGIGLAVAYELLLNGVHCVVCSGETCTDRTNSMRHLNDRFGKGKAVYFPADVTNDLDFNRLFQYAIGRFNRVDILFNNAGLWTDCKWEACIDTNICSIGRGSLLALDYMGANKNGCGGIVVNCGSTLSFDCVPSCPAYCASQHAIVAITECLGDPFHSENAKLRFVSLCPGLNITEMSYKSPELGLSRVTKRWLENQKPQDMYPIAKSFIYVVKYGLSGHHYVVDGTVLSDVQIPDKDVFGEPLCYYKKKKFFGFI